MILCNKGQKLQGEQIVTVLTMPCNNRSWKMWPIDMATYTALFSIKNCSNLYIIVMFKFRGLCS